MRAKAPAEHLSSLVVEWYLAPRYSPGQGKFDLLVSDLPDSLQMQTGEGTESMLTDLPQLMRSLPETSSASLSLACVL